MKLSISNFNANSLFKNAYIDFIIIKNADSREKKEILIKKNLLDTILQDKDITIITDS